MRIGTSVFRGAIKAIEESRLGDEYAAEAVNCDLRTGALVPLKGKSDLWSVPGAAEKIYLWDDKLACFTQKDISVLPHPNNDNLVWTGSDYGIYPRQASKEQFFGTGSAGLPVESSRFGLDEPPSAPMVHVNGEATGDLIRSTSYRFSAVAVTGEESNLSLPSAVVDVYEGQTAELYRLWPTAEIPEFVDKIRIYRAETDSYGSPSWAFVTELPAATVKYSDIVEETEEVAQSDGWLPPENFEGLVDIGNGIVAGWKGRDVCLSEVGVPTAFPEKYRLRTDATIRGIGMTGAFAIVLTDKEPSILSASTPESATMASLQFGASCLSARSICSTKYGVVFASHEGLMQITSGGVPSILTEGILSREQWLAYGPENMVCVPQDDKIYIFRYGQTVALLYDMRRSDFTEIELPFAVSDAHVDSAGGRILLLNSADSVGALGEGENLQFRWKSGLYLFPNTKVFSAARILGEQSVTSPAVLTIWRDGLPFYSKTVTDQRPFALPPGLYLSLQFEISGTTKIVVVQIASDMSELK
ncbi:MAG: hypothetical protein V3573_14405 [Desulfovibrionaceae bacterium]